MSQLKTNSITNIGNQGDDNITLNSDGSTVVQDLTANNVTATSYNTGQLAGFRNQIINGNMLIAQRGTGPVTSTALTGTYSTVDRFAVDDVTAQQFTITDLPGFSKGLSITAGGRYKIRQPVELWTIGSNSQFGVGSTWTLSLYSTQDISSGSFSGYFVDAKEGTNLTVVVENEPWVLIETVGSWKRYAVSFTVNATPVATNKAFNVEMTVVAGTYTGIQLEPGPVATPFEQRPIGTELALCQRYTYALTNSNQSAYFPISGFAKTSSQVVVVINYPVTMRVDDPSFTVKNGETNFKVFVRASTASVTSITGSDQTANGGCYNIFADANSFDVGDSVVLGTGTTAGGNGFIISAEL
tara:strand:+ start:290 stop:1357 length:1068 start_codon:yes stop_codon:yes gene_type:complete